MNQLSNSGFLRITDVLQLIPIGKSTWWAGVKDGRFPKPVKIGPRLTLWRAEDIRQLIETESFGYESREGKLCKKKDSK